MHRKIEITENISERLDAYLSREMEGHTRSFIKNLIDSADITVNGGSVKSGYKPRAGDIIAIELPEPMEAEALPEDIPLDIVYEDEDIAVINKPQGMVTHPAAGNMTGTLVNAALFHIKGLSGIGGVSRPGIVHRLDKDTSGLIIIAKNDAAHGELCALIKDRKLDKTYIALCHGNIKTDSGTIVTGIDRHPRERKRMAVSPAGREAITHYRVLKRYGKYTLVEFVIETGRTHQIRVHAKHIGHPVVGDVVYTKLKDPFAISGQLLHAQKLGFQHPITGERMEMEAPLPPHFVSVLEILDRE